MLYLCAVTWMSFTNKMLNKLRVAKKQCCSISLSGSCLHESVYKSKVTKLYSSDLFTFLYVCGT